MFGGSWDTSGRWERQDNEGTMLLLLLYVLLAASELRGALLNDSPGAHRPIPGHQHCRSCLSSGFLSLLLDTEVAGDW